MKLKIFGCFINSTVIRCQHEQCLAISRHEIFGVVTSLNSGGKRGVFGLLYIFPFTTSSVILISKVSTFMILFYSVFYHDKKTTKKGV